MLGAELVDDEGADGGGRTEGLRLLPVRTTFAAEKLTRRVTARVARTSALWSSEQMQEWIDGYEIHMGRTIAVTNDERASPSFEIADNARRDGCTSADGLVVGTYMHGLLENAELRRAMLSRLANAKGCTLPPSAPPTTADEAIDALADATREHLDLEAIGRMVGLTLR
jgi:adenosylcobyric acid synthase